MAAVCAVFAAAACGSGNDEVTSTPVSATGPIASTLATLATTSTAPATPSTTEPAPTTSVTAVPSSTATPSPTSVATSSTLEVGERADELVVVWASGIVAFHDPDTGLLLDIVTSFGNDGSFVYGPAPGRDGTTYLATNVEDSWYSCETADGEVIALTAEGASTPIGPGSLPAVSADGAQLAYTRSSECRPDPQEPDMWVVTVRDTIVVRELATGEERSWTFPGAYDDASLQSVVVSVMWYGDALLALIDGRLVRVDVSDPAIPAVDEGTVVELATDEQMQVALLGARTDGTILVNLIQSPARIVALDPTTGHEVAEVAVFDSWALASADQSGMRWATIANGTVIIDGHETVLEVPDVVEDHPVAVGW